MRHPHAPSPLLALLALIPTLALAQSPDLPIPTPYDEPIRWGPSWLWLTVLAVVLVSLLAWGLSRDRTHRPGGPPII